MSSYKILITNPKKISVSKSINKRTSSMPGFEKLKGYGFELIEFPTIKIVHSKNCKAFDIAIQKINSYTHLIFTSKNSVNFFMQKFFAAGKTKKDIKKVKVCAIGDKTAEEIKKWKIKVDLIPDEFNAEGLIEEVVKGFSPQTSRRGGKDSRLRRAAEAARGRVFKGLRFLLPKGGKARKSLPERIKQLGGKVDSLILYKTVKPEINRKQIKKILDQKFSAVAFTSPSAFDNFTEMLGKKAHEFLRNTLIAVIGPVTAEAVKRTGFKVSIIPHTATINSMTNEIVRFFKKNKK